MTHVARRRSGWRNTLDFSPLTRYGRWSYAEAILYPLADAIASALEPETRVDFVLQGEMGATAFFHPDDWVRTRELVQRRMAAAQNATLDNLRFGLSVNNNKMCG